MGRRDPASGWSTPPPSGAFTIELLKTAKPELVQSAHAVWGAVISDAVCQAQAICIKRMKISEITDKF
jgi:hypothetical protein